MLQTDFRAQRSLLHVTVKAVLFIVCSLLHSPAVHAQASASPEASRSSIKGTATAEAARRALRPRQPDRLVHRPVRQQEARARRPRGDARTLGFKHFAYDWRAEHIPTFDAEVDALEAARRRARRLLGRPGRAEPRVADHPRRAQAPRRRRPSSGSCSTSAPTRSRAPSRSAGSRPPRPSSGRWPRRPARSAARWPSTTTAAGSASPRTRSRSSSG